MNLVANLESSGAYQLVGVAIDISEQVRHEEQNLFLGKILERSLNEIYIFDANTLEFIQVNYGALNNLGYSEEEIKQLTPLDLKHDLSRAQFESLIQPLQSGEKSLVEFETAHYRKDGSSYPVHVSLQKDASSDGDVFVAFINDITEVKRSESKINFLAFHDVLTALPNQSLLDERINQAIINSHRDKAQFALLYMDLDRFKIINDTLGHASGDKLLKAVALRLKANVREQDTVSRTGGDEFTVLLVDTDQKGAARVAENLLTAVAQPFVINKQTFHVTTSIGISMYPDNGETGPLLKQKADNAMYRAKEHKRNCFQFFTEDMHRKMLHRMHVESELHEAIKNNEFSLVYQPQLDLASNRMIGAEALLRWRNTNLGQVPPNVFIPIAEESGLISEIGDWVLNEAIKQAGRWRDQIPRPFIVAINISGFQFRNSLLADSISTLLRKHGLESGDIEIEVTETVAMHDMAYSIEQMQTLSNAGIHLAMDDFGTGFSSLSALKKFPINKLKIDKSFIDDMLTDDDNSAIVDAVITLAKTLKLRTVAEGVESDSQLKMLRNKGCHAIQGYLFSKPVSADEMLKLSKEYGS
jgi:diguanylate cyclase (GGDEF)-like protein/PAS domain S-box-containing protein